MGTFEDAVIYATKKLHGKKKLLRGVPAILHPIEVAQILSSITLDEDLMIAGILHDVVEDTDATIEEIRELFGDKVAELVDAVTDASNKEADSVLSWKRQKEEAVKKLKARNDREVELIWLADKLSAVRVIASAYSELGDKLWEDLEQGDSETYLWYYKMIMEVLEMNHNRTGIFKEFVKHINSIWPGTFASEKSKYKKYREVSVEGCEVIGRGAKGEVYRYDEELVLKLYNEKNQYKDIERENSLARQAFVAGIPTAISFGIVKVGNRYGSMFELLESNTVSSLIAADPSKVETYAGVMAELAQIIHSIDVIEENMTLPSFMPEVFAWLDGGISYEDQALTEKIRAMLEALPRVNTVIHGDFHTGNVMSQKREYLLIDMDRLSVCHPIVELCGLYMFYVGFGELDPSMVESFMGFSYETSKEFYRLFMEKYLGTKEIEPVVKKAALLCYVRLVRRCYKKGIHLSEADAKARDYYMKKIYALLEEVDSFEF